MREIIDVVRRGNNRKDTGKPPAYNDVGATSAPPPPVAPLYPIITGGTLDITRGILT